MFYAKSRMPVFDFFITYFMILSFYYLKFSLARMRFCLKHIC